MSLNFDIQSFKALCCVPGYQCEPGKLSFPWLLIKKKKKELCCHGCFCFRLLNCYLWGFVCMPFWNCYSCAVCLWLQCEFNIILTCLEPFFFLLTSGWMFETWIYHVLDCPWSWFCEIFWKNSRLTFSFLLEILFPSSRFCMYIGATSRTLLHLISEFASP